MKEDIGFKLQVKHLGSKNLCEWHARLEENVDCFLTAHGAYSFIKYTFNFKSVLYCYIILFIYFFIYNNIFFLTFSHGLAEKKSLMYNEYSNVKLS